MSLGFQWKVLLVAVVLAQASLPLWSLFATSSTARWSWQMYSRISTEPTIVIIRANGEEDKIDPTAYFGLIRRDMPHSSRLQKHLEKHLEPGESLKLIPVELP